MLAFSQWQVQAPVRRHRRRPVRLAPSHSSPRVTGPKTSFNSQKQQNSSKVSVSFHNSHGRLVKSRSNVTHWTCTPHLGVVLPIGCGYFWSPLPRLDSIRVWATVVDRHWFAYRKYALTLQLQTAHILSAHATLEQKMRSIQDLKEQKNK